MATEKEKAEQAKAQADKEAAARAEADTKAQAEKERASAEAKARLAGDEPLVPGPDASINVLPASEEQLKAQAEEEERIREAGLIKVQSKEKANPKDGSHVIALWDVHPSHPKGEVYIADDQVHEVALTFKVAEALRNGSLIKVG